LIRLRDGDAIEELRVAADQTLRLTIPPGVSHAVQNVGHQPNVMLAFNTVAHTPERPDVFPDVLIERMA
jgi:hypothetical protein